MPKDGSDAPTTVSLPRWATVANIGLRAVLWLAMTVLIWAVFDPEPFGFLFMFSLFITYLISHFAAMLTVGLWVHRRQVRQANPDTAERST